MERSGSWPERSEEKSSEHHRRDVKKMYRNRIEDRDYEKIRKVDDDDDDRDRSRDRYKVCMKNRDNEDKKNRVVLAKRRKDSSSSHHHDHDDDHEESGAEAAASSSGLCRPKSEIEKRILKVQGVSANNSFEDLSFSDKISSDYYTHEEILKLKNPKKQKSLRKKEKLDIDALEAEAVSAGLGLEDLGSRKDGRRQDIREKQQKSEAEQRSNAYQLAYVKADEASKALRLEHTVTVKQDDDENTAFASDDDDIYKSFKRASNLDLKKKNEELPTGPQAIALLLTTTSASKNPASGEPEGNKVIFTEMGEFVWGLQLHKEDQKLHNEDVFMEETYKRKASDQKVQDEAGGWTEVKDEELVMDVTMHEVPVGKGLWGSLKLLKERGTLKEPVEWGGRNTDK